MKKKVLVFYVEKGGSEWPSNVAMEFVAWFTEKLKSIPEENIATAQIEINHDSDDESSYYASIEISYFRDETSDEQRTRKTAELSRQEAQKVRELRTLAELKMKYEGQEHG